jgi:TM2 domain-containing membrane protein YozV
VSVDTSHITKGGGVSFLLRIERELTPSERSLFRSRYEPDAKSRTTAIVLGIFLGVFGAHRFYLGQIGWGFGYLLVLGWTALIAGLNVVVWIGVVIEVLVAVSGRVEDHNRDHARAIRDEIVFLRETAPMDGGASAAQADGSVAQLERLASLREKGHLTDEEFKTQKRKVLED